MSNNKTHLTARARSNLSAPAAYLLKEGLLEGRILDFGCGKGDLHKFLDGDIEQWDPHFHPAKPRGKFDVVCCIYVLNVLRAFHRMQAMRHAMNYVRRGGSLYIAVRRDRFVAGVNSKGTEQYHVLRPLPMYTLTDTLVHRKGAFEIFSWKNDGKW